MKILLLLLLTVQLYAQEDKKVVYDYILKDTTCYLEVMQLNAQKTMFYVTVRGGKYIKKGQIATFVGPYKYLYCGKRRYKILNIITTK